MEAFLGVAKGSAEKPWLLELRYNYTDAEEEMRKGQDPVVLVGKGNNLLVSFDWLYLGRTLTLVILPCWVLNYVTLYIGVLRWLQLCFAVSGTTRSLLQLLPSPLRHTPTQLIHTHTNTPPNTHTQSYTSVVV